MKKTFPPALPGRILLLALLLGIVWDRLFYARAPGIALFLYLLFLLGSLHWLARSKGIRPRRRNLWLIVPLLGLSLMIALRAESGLRLLNLLAILSLLGLVAYFFSDGRLGALGFFDYPTVLVSVGGQALFQAAPLLPHAIDGEWFRHVSGQRVFILVRGILLALPLLLLFTLLLFSADLVFAAYVNGFFDLDLFEILLEGAWRTFLILLLAWVVAGGLAYTLLRVRPDRPPFPSRIQAQLAGQFSLGVGEGVIILSLINTLFLSFVWIQFAYLFGGRTHLVLEGFTYAEYARRGFFELVAVAVTALALIRGLRWLASPLSVRRRRPLNILATVMIGLVLVMLASAFLRLRLYEVAFGYTRLRLMVHLFIIWLGLLLGWQMLALWWQSERRPGFALAVLVASLGFLFTLNSLNPDALIASQNLARYRDTGKVDVYYLANLSADAVPALAPVVSAMRGENRETLCRALRRQQWRLAEEDETWTSFNLGRWRARQALSQPDWQMVCPPLEPRS